MHLERLRDGGQHEPGSRRLLSHHVSHTEECHACRRLLPRPPGPHLDRGHVRIRAGHTREPSRHRTPASPPIHAGHAAKDAGGDQRTRSHGRKHQPWGSLGQQLAHSSQPRTASPADFPQHSNPQHVRSPPIPMYDHASPTAGRQPDDNDPGRTPGCLVALNFVWPIPRGPGGSRRPSARPSGACRPTRARGRRSAARSPAPRRPGLLPR
jgi:hypothetical protein